MLTMLTMLTMKRYVLLAALLVAVPTFAGQPQTGTQSGEPSSQYPRSARSPPSVC